SWTFTMEHYCGILQAALRSRRSPWSNLNGRILHTAYLSQVRVKYDLEDKLGDFHCLGPSRSEDQLSRHKCVYDHSRSWIRSFWHHGTSMGN
ncbi:hypothetical protein OG21DRAFT_1416597, partial [Imleria badia]